MNIYWLMRFFILFKFNIKEYRYEFPEEKLLSYQPGHEIGLNKKRLSQFEAASFLFISVFQEFRTALALSSSASVMKGIPVTASVSRLAVTRSSLLSWEMSNFLTPAINCCSPQASLSA